MMALTIKLLEQRLIESTLVASSTVLLYDWLCTLDQEVAYVWTKPWSISSMLFFLNRYAPFIDTSLSLGLKFSTELNEPKCLRSYAAVTWMIVLGTLFSEAIFMLRTYAIWERSRAILITLCLLASVVLIPALVITKLELDSLRYSRRLPGCHLIYASPVILGAYILIVLSETILVVLTFVRGYRHCRDLQSSWIRQLYKDGIVFYFYVLAISLANIIVPLVAPPIFANWLATPQRIIHSILCNRVLFLVFRQRFASSLTNYLPGTAGARPESASPMVYTSYVEGENENETSAEIMIEQPSVMSVSGSGDDGEAMAGDR